MYVCIQEKVLMNYSNLIHQKYMCFLLISKRIIVEAAAGIWAVTIVLIKEFNIFHSNNKA